MTTIHEEHERRMLDWHGLRPSKARECLRVVLGKRCTAGNSWREDCLCQTVQQQAHRRRAFDHVRIWLDADGRHVLTSEPYNRTPDRTAEITGQMAAIGVTVTVSDRSPWYPGSTTLLLMTASTTSFERPGGENSTTEGKQRD